VAVSYLIIIGDLMPQVVGSIFPGSKSLPFLLDRQFWITSFMYAPFPSCCGVVAYANDRLVIIPLSFLRRLDSLKYTSVIALLALGYLVLTVVAHFLMGDTIDQRGEVHWFKTQGPMRFFSNLPVIIFAFTCHQNVPLSSLPF